MHLHWLTTNSTVQHHDIIAIMKQSYKTSHEGRCQKEKEEKHVQKNGLAKSKTRKGGLGKK